jgi:hypothetical protein
MTLALGTPVKISFPGTDHTMYGRVDEIGGGVVVVRLPSGTRSTTTEAWVTPLATPEEWARLAYWDQLAADRKKLEAGT